MTHHSQTNERPAENYQLNARVLTKSRSKGPFPSKKDDAGTSADEIKKTIRAVSESVTIGDESVGVRMLH